MVIFVPDPLRLLYSGFFEKNGVSGEYVEVKTIGDMKGRNFPRYKEKRHVFLDELQLFVDLQQEDKFFVWLKMNLQDKQHYLWITHCGTLQFRSQHRIGPLVELLQLSYKNSRLLTVMRNSKTIFKLLKVFEGHELKLRPTPVHVAPMQNATMHLGHNVHECPQLKLNPTAHAPEVPMRIIQNTTMHLGHNVPGCLTTIDCKNREDVFDAIKKNVIDKYKGKDYKSKIAILVPSQDYMVECTKLLKDSNFMVGTVGYEDGVVVDLIENSQSYEWETVIVVSLGIFNEVHHDCDTTNFIAFSRAVVQLIILKSEISSCQSNRYSDDLHLLKV